jgi:hypothetical protein
VPLSSYGYALEGYRRKVDRDDPNRTWELSVAIGFQNMSPSDGYWLGKGKDHQRQDTDLVQAKNFSLITMDAAFISRQYFSRYFGIHYGAGLGLAVVRGKILRTSAVCDPATGQCHVQIATGRPMWRPQQRRAPKPNLAQVKARETRPAMAIASRKPPSPAPSPSSTCSSASISPSPTPRGSNSASRAASTTPSSSAARPATSSMGTLGFRLDCGRLADDRAQNHAAFSAQDFDRQGRVHRRRGDEGARVALMGEGARGRAQHDVARAKASLRRRRAGSHRRDLRGAVWARRRCLRRPWLMGTKVMPSQPGRAWPRAADPRRRAAASRSRGRGQAAALTRARTDPRTGERLDRLRLMLVVLAPLAPGHRGEHEAHAQKRGHADLRAIADLVGGGEPVASRLASARRAGSDIT